MLRLHVIKEGEISSPSFFLLSHARVQGRGGGKFLVPPLLNARVRACKGREEGGKSSSRPSHPLPLFSSLSLFATFLASRCAFLSLNHARKRVLHARILRDQEREERMERRERVREIKISLFSAGFTHALMGAI